MFAVSTYEEIEQIERNVENMEVVVLLFVKPTNSDAMDIIREFEYIHHNSYKYCSIYAIGYSNDFDKATNQEYTMVDTTFCHEWYFSMKAFVDFKKKLEKRINWDYSGGTEVLILQNNPGKEKSLNFSNYVAIDVNKGIKEGYIDSFQRFMEALVRSSKSKVTAKEVSKDIANSRISIKGIVADSIDDCKKIPKSIKVIIKDRLFYRSASCIEKGR